MHRTLGLALVLASSGLVLFACGTDTAAPGNSTSQDAGPGDDPGPATTDDAGTDPASDAGPDVKSSTPSDYKLTFPQVLSRGGTVIAQPKVVPVIFKGDPFTTNITDFTKKLAASSYWTDQAAEYGVGALTVADPIVLDEPAPQSTTSDEIETWLVGKLTGSTPALGAPDASTLYAVFYPSGTSITAGSGAIGQSCQGYGGYHNELKAGGVNVGYAVLPRCSDIDELGIATSHEFFEWATDPFPMTSPGYNKLDDDHWVWQLVMIGELGDLCTFVDRDPLLLPEIGVKVQRQWSNKLSKAGAFPCAPVKPVAWLQAAPAAVDDVSAPDVTFKGPVQNLKTKAILVPPGKSKTVDVIVYSDKPVGTKVPMKTIGYDTLYGRTDDTGFTFTLDQDYANVGDTVHLTVHAPTTPAFDVALSFAYTGQESANFWPVLVTNTNDVSTAQKAPGFFQEPMDPDDVPQWKPGKSTRRLASPTQRSLRAQLPIQTPR